MKAVIKLTKRQERIYLKMRYEAKRNYKIYGNWDWTMTNCWDDQERSFDISNVNSIAQSKLKLLETDLKLNIFTKEEYDLEKGILNQVIKFCNERIKFYKN